MFLGSKSSRCRQRLSPQKGFALVCTLSILALLCLFIFANIQLSQRETKRSKRNSVELSARANAKLALAIAISQIQLYTGKDQTTTCRADLLDQRNTPLASADPSIAHPFYTLAFQTSPIDEDHTKYGKGVFLRAPEKLPACLVSSNEAYNLLTNTSDNYPESYVTPSTSLEDTPAVTIFTQADHLTKVPLVKLPGTKGLEHNYAYWVADENLKARINLDQQVQQSPASSEVFDSTFFNAIRAPSSVGRSHAGQNETSRFLEHIDNPQKYLTPQSFSTLGVLQAKGISQTRSDFTTVSRSVLCDLKHGGLKKNLTAACALTDLEFQELTNHRRQENSHQNPVFLYQQWCFPSESDQFSFSHYPGSPWELIRSYIRRPEFENNLTGARPQLLSHLGGNAHKLSHYWQYSDQSYIPTLHARLVRRSPILLRFQIGVDYSIGYSGLVLDEETNEQWHEFQLRQHFIPFASYWNPYNVDLRVSEPIQYHIHLDKDWSSGSHDTLMKIHLPNHIQWKHKTPQNNQWTENTGTTELTYPFHEKGSAASKSELSRCSFHIPPFSIEAGKTKLFLPPQNNQLLRYKKSQRNSLTEVKNLIHSGNSFFSKNLTIRLKNNINPELFPGIPELEILRYPTEGGKEHTRLHVTNASSFQRINWNFASVTEKASLRFLPALLTDSDALPESDLNNTSSPKFSGVVIRKSPNINHYFPRGAQWNTKENFINSNAYTAPWFLLYQTNAARYGAFGAKAGEATSFTSPPQYLTGIILGSSQLLKPDLSSDGQSFVGYNDTFTDGSHKAIHIALPRYETRCFSPAHLSQLNSSKWLSNYNADQSNASATDALSPNASIGNSFISPHIPPHKTSITVDDKNAFSSDLTSTHYDSSFRFNEALWDRYFFTGLRNGEAHSIEEFTENIPSKLLTVLDEADINTLNSPHLSATQLMLNGGFNINSTSVEAWKTVLGSTVGLNSSATHSPPYLTPFPRLQYTESTAYSTPPTDPTHKSYYTGELHRSLTESEINTLAENIVIQNKLRGPYTTLSQFINRSLSPSHHYRHTAVLAALDSETVCYEGPIQAAINSSNINGAFNKSNSHYPAELEANEYEIADYQAGKINPKALKYHTGYGAPGTLTQSDILYRIGHMLTARSDTFTIRAYGDCRSADGEILARAYCEAVVQRTPQYMSTLDSAETPPQKWILNKKDSIPINGHWSPNNDLSPQSKQLGRRYKIIQFRWLHPSEI